MRTAVLGILHALGSGCLVMVLAHSAVGAERSAAPPELGAVNWRRDFPAAAAEADRNGQPLLVLFQEIPGCGTCLGFGQGALSHPLLVEAMESEFVPLLVRNNHPGPESELLRRFHEPAWNNPVVRFLTPEFRDLIPRREGIWTAWETAARMTAALRAADRPVPPWLDLVALERDAGNLESAVFGVHCFWEGESGVGGLDGVVETEAGFHGGQEVVTVRFDPSRLPFARLLSAARERPGVTTVLTTSIEQERAAAQWPGLAFRRLDGPVRRAPESDQKRFLRASPLAGLGLTAAQAARINAALAGGDDGLAWLSPRQRARLP